MQRKYFDEMNIFRCLVLIWVVIGHSFFKDGIFGFFYDYAYSFHMPAFMMLSGFLFAGKQSRINSVKSAAGEIGNRFLRLMVPYFVHSAVTYGLKLFMQDYAYNKLGADVFADILLGQNNPNGGLWFLYALFFISVFSIILCRLPMWLYLLIFAALKVVETVTGFEFWVISTVAFYGVFFAVGVFVRKYYHSISERLFKALRLGETKVRIVSFAVFLLAISVLTVYFLKDNPIWSSISVLFTFYQIFTWYIIAVAVCSFKRLKKPAMIIGNYGMDIYMFSYYVQVGLRVVFITMLGLPQDPVSVFMVIFGLILPVIVSKYIVRKIPVLNALLLGNFKNKSRSNAVKK